MKAKNLYQLIVISLVSIITAGCDGSEDSEQDGLYGPDARTLIVFMESNNDLADYATLDLQEMSRGMASGAGGRLIVFHHTVGARPVLMEIDNKGLQHTLKTYEPDPSPLTIEGMRTAIADAKAAAPSSHYGLVLWSHASGWLNDKNIITEEPDVQPDPDSTETTVLTPLSFGADLYPSAKRMSLSSLERALRGNTFDFIYFDCCHMATVEVAYELRQITPHIIASPTELGLEGMPYDRNLKPLFAAVPELDLAMRQTFESYNGDPNGCTITHIATAGLIRLADISREVLAAGDHMTPYTPAPYFRTRVMKSGIWDMYSYFNHLTRNDPELQRRWNEAFSQVVTNALTTPRAWTLDASDFHGLGVNILSESNPPSVYGYDQTRWYADVVAR